MRIVRGIIGVKKNLGKELSITIGNFDGVHMGHQELIKETVCDGYTSVVMTFSPHPLVVCKPKFSYHFLTPLSKKIEYIRVFNPHYLFIVDFDIYGASKSKEDFIKWLHELGVKRIVCGPDYHFGHRASGNVHDLEKEFIVKIIPNLMINNIRVSSTVIKDYLENGQIEEANKCLGRPYNIDGLVIHGSQIGIKLGFPTANIDIFGNTIPKKGVYAVRVVVKNKKYYGMANIGNNPTVNYQLNERLEVHLFDYNGDLYGKNVSVSFLYYLRGEKTFASADELILQLHKDCQFLKKWVLDYKN